MTARRFVIDVESTSTANLKRLGAAAYWEHPGTRIICVCYAVDDNPVGTWRPGDPVPYFVGDMILSWDDWRLIAHNWLFEFNCWKNHLALKHGWPSTPVRVWDCTMARALYWGLPAGLEDVGAALNLPIKKDATARALMLRMSRPRTVEIPGVQPTTWWHETDPDKLKALEDYCVQDVEAERCLDAALPPLPPRERQIFLIDGKINQRGIRVDLPMIAALDKITKAEGVRLNADIARLTAGAAKTTNQVAVILAQLAARGWAAPDLTRATVKDMLARIVETQGQWDATGAGLRYEPKVRAILECRQEAAKASTAKLAAMSTGASAHDDRCRGLFQYGGAGRTLRWAGRRVQPQNYPRGTVKDLPSIFRLVEQGIPVDELAALLPGTVMDAVSSCLRGCFIPAPGHSFVSGDLSQIEARVVAWLAGQNDLLDVFARGEDVYVYTAARIGSKDRQLGKVLVLACGFGMGPDKFRDTAATYGITLDTPAAEAAVRAWRDANSKIVSFWWDVDREAKRVAASPHGTEGRVGRIGFRKTRKALRIVLPSGREMTYQNIEVAPEADCHGRDEISYMGVDPKTKAWTRLRTYGGKLVENIVQATARDVMAEAMIVLARSDARMVGTVHDELIAEAPDDQADARLAHLLKVMRTTPAWAPGLPVGAEGFVAKRYKK